MKEKIIGQDYYVTYEPSEADHNEHYNPKISALLDKYHELVARKKPRLLPKLIKLVKDYPRVPAFRNYVTAYYAMTGNQAKAAQINRKIVEQFPNYLFGVTSAAAERLKSEDYDGVKELLGPKLDIGSRFPDRKIFHYSEYISFNSIVIRYLLATHQFEILKRNLPAYEQVFAEDDQLLSLVRMQVSMGKLFDAAATARSTKLEYDTTLASKEAPSFTHPEVKQLHTLELKELATKIPKLEQLPEKSLLEDLGKLFADSIYRYEYWQERDDKELDFVFSALMLLAHFRGDTQLPVLLTALRQGEEFLEFWYNDALTEDWWRFLYPVGKNQLPLLVDFLKKPDVYVFAKTVLLEVLVQVALHEPERTEEVALICKDLLRFMLDHQDDPAIFDPEFCAHLAMYVPVFRDREMMKLTEKIYETNTINSFFATYKDLEEDFRDASFLEREKKPVFRDVYEEIERFIKYWN